MKLTRRRPPSHLALACLALSLFALALMPATAGAAPGEETGWPLSPRPEVVRGFEAPAKPWLPGHRGVDLAGSPGQAVLSATAGTITYAGPLAGRGVIVVTRGPIRTTYEPVVAALPPGTAVNPGDTIGHLSAAASHCAPATCLHWGLRQSDTYLNPLTLLPTQPVRLLPHTPAEPQALRPHTPRQPQALHARTAPPQPEERPARTPVTPPRLGPVPTLAPALTPAAGGPVDPQAAPTPHLRSQPPTDTFTPLASDPPGGAASAIVVAVAGALTIGSALLISRH